MSPKTQGRPAEAGARHPQIGVGGFAIGARAKQLVMEVLDSNRLSAGPMMARFEGEIARLHGCRYGLMCNSGTSALQIAVAALKERHGWRDGDEVLVPAVTFIATSNVVLYNAMRPVFVDVDPLYYTIDPGQIESRITPRTRAVMPVHLAGQACDMDPILEIARRRNLKIIEDSAETMFVGDRGRPVGSFGEIGCFSTYAAHLITTGVGGLCTTNDAELLVLLKSLMNHGRDLDDDENLSGKALFEVANSRFSFVRLGHSFRATEMEAALGLAQLEEREVFLAQRRRLAALLHEGLSPLSGRLQLPAARPGAEHAYMFYPLTILDPGVARDDLIAHLEDRGVETRYLLPLINQPVYRNLFGNLDAEFPVAARLNRDAFYVGCHPGMSDEDARYVARCFVDFFRERG